MATPTAKLMSLTVLRAIIGKVDSAATACSRRMKGDDGDEARWFEVRSGELDLLKKTGLAGHYTGETVGTRYDWRYIFEVNVEQPVVSDGGGVR